MSETVSPYKKKSRIIRRIARIWGTLIIVYVSIFIIGMTFSLITEGETDPHSEDDVETLEYSGPVLILISTIGLALAFKWEGLGGGIVIGCQILFWITLLIQRPISLQSYFMGPLIISLFVLVPGMFYMAYWKREKHSRVQ